MVADSGVRILNLRTGTLIKKSVVLCAYMYSHTLLFHTDDTVTTVNNLCSHGIQHKPYLSYHKHYQG